MAGSVLSPRYLTAGRWLFRFVILASVAGICLIAWVGVRGALAVAHLNQVKTGASAASSVLVSDPSSAVRPFTELASDASTASELTSDPIWKLASHLPWIGPQLHAVAAVAASTNGLLSDALTPIVEAAGSRSLSALKPVDGRIDIDSVGALHEPLAKAAKASTQSVSTVAEVDRTPLVPMLSSALDEAESALRGISTGLDASARATQLLPAVLGQNEPRQYLLLVQNNAEWRSLGGITGTVLLLRTDNGAISLSDTRSASGLSNGVQAPILNLPDDWASVYGTKPTRFFQNITEIPDFPLAGDAARQMYLSQTGVNVDGVIAVDPVALSYVLQATGPVALSDGEELTADNAVPLLLSQVYSRYPRAGEQDAFFAGAAGAIFQAFIDGSGSIGGLFSALARGAQEHRLLFWSANADEQAVLDGSVFAGDLPVTDDHTVRLGVYLNDGTGSKMSYYLQPEISFTWDECNAIAGAARQLTLNATLTNTAPSDAATSLPTYVTGNGAYGTAPGSAATVTNVFLPAGWEVVRVETSNGLSPVSAEVGQRQVLTFDSVLAPQSSAAFAIVIRSTGTATVAEAYVTPTADADVAPVISSECEPSGVATLR